MKEGRIFKSMHSYLCIAFLFFAGVLNAATIYIATTGNDTTGDGSVGNPYLTLNKALTVASDGDEISCAAGTYDDDDITFPATNNITVTGNGIGSTIFDGDGDASSSERFMTISGSVTGVKIQDLTIQDMDVSDHGAGIYLTTSGTITIEDVVFDNCDLKSSGDKGAGVYVSSSTTATIDRCLFKNNNTYNSSTSYGACIYTEGTTTIQNCLMYDNNTNYSSTLNSGMIHNVTGTVNIYNCTITENTETGTYRADIYASSGTVTAKNCIIFNNQGTDAFYRVAGTSSFTYSLFETGTSGTITLSNNITNSDVDPLFKAASSDDFTISATSPCRDKGNATSTPTVDYSSATRGAGGTNTGSAYDIGCYENVCASGTYYVNDAVDDGTELWATAATGNDANSGGTGDPYLTLDKALKECGCPGNTIRVDAGTYSDDNLVVSTDATSSALTIQGAGSTLTIFDADVDAVTTERFMTFNVDADNISFTDATVKDADISDHGAGFNLTTTGSITLQDLIIDNCDLASSGDKGAGVYVSSSSTSTIDRCIFRNNNTYNSSSSYGACVYTEGTTTIQNCLMYDNRTNYSSSLNSGMIHNVTGTVNVYNCTITENTEAGTSVAEVYISSGTGSIYNSIIYNNQGTYAVYEGTATVGLHYSLYETGTSGTITTSNNITNSDVNPLFMDTSSDDFSISAISPARDKASESSMPTVDLESKTRGSGGTNTGTTYDMGCYENTCAASSYYVNDGVDDGTELWATTGTGSDSNDGSTSNPFLTLDYALKKCGCPGSTIYVDAGTYEDDNLVLSTDATSSELWVTGAGASLTIFDGDRDADATERFITINVDADNVRFSDMTVKDMDVSNNGAGFELTTSGSITIQDITLDNCDLSSSGDKGAGVYVASTATGIIDRCIFKNNNTYNSSTSYGACVYTEGTTTIQNCLMYDNNTNYSSGLNSGMIHNVSGTANIYNCTITENTETGTYRADIYASSGTVTATNCIIYNNQGTDAFYRAAGTSTFTYSLYETGTSGTITTGNNITDSDTDPLFKDTSSDDFSIGAMSPCRDAGTESSMPSVDTIEGNRGTGAVYGGTTYDIGAYENSCKEGIFYVNDNSTSGDIWASAVGNDANAGSTSAPFLTLEHALDECGCPGNTIRVDAGTYSDDNLVLSVDGTAAAFKIVGAGEALTIFDCDVDVVTTERFMTINGDADNITISDMTIKDADVSDNGAAFNLTTTGSITFEDLIIDNCDLASTGDKGAGFYVSSSSTATIDRCIFRNNNTYNSSSSYGACIYTEGTTTVQNCLMYDNNTNYSSTLSSGMIHNVTGTLNVYNCTITENTETGTYAADLYISSGTASIYNCIIFNNQGTDAVYEGTATVGLHYSLYETGTSGTITTSNNLTNSDVDPIFMDTSTDNFKISAISPALDAGDETSMPTIDINEIARGSSGVNTQSTYDMGCYENECVPGTYYVNDASTTGDVWVTAVGNDANAGTTAAPFLTITEALKVCGCDNNSLKVDAGTYSDDDLSMSASSFTMQGAGADLTIVDGDADADATERFMTVNVAATSFTVSDMTIKDMDVSDNGAAFNITSSGSITLQDLIIDNCDLSSSGDKGAGVYVSSSSTATIDRCIFRNNNTYNSSTSYGSCIYTEGTTTVQNCLMYDNNTNYSSTLNSGVIHNVSGTANIYNCTITENTETGTYRADVYASSGTVTATNCIIYNNQGTDAFYRASGTSSFTYSLFDTGSSGTITESNNDEASAPSFTNAAGDDFTIGSGSACENTGTGTSMPTYDLVEATRPYGGAHDIGAYEYSPVFYWVGGTGNWSDYSNHWSTSSGTAADQGNAPTSSDNVVFDANSTGTVTIDATANCANFIATGSDVTVAGSSDMSIYGHLKLDADNTWSNTGTITFASTATGKEIQTNGVTLTSNLDFNGSGGEWTLQDAMTVGGNITLSDGTLIASANDVSLPGNWVSNGGVFTAGTGTVTFTGSASTIGGTDATENFYNLTINQTAGQALTTTGSVTTLALANNFTQTLGNCTPPATFTVGTDFTLTAGTYTAASSLTVGNDMLLTSGTYTAGSNSASIAGNFTNNGATFTAGTSTFTLTGTAKQITGSSGSTFYNLTCNGTNTLNVATTVENTLTLGATITVDNTTLSIGTTSANGSISGASSSSYIVASDIGDFIGYLKVFVNSNAAYTLPVGDEDDYTPMTFTLNSNGGLSSAYVQAYSDIAAIDGTGSIWGSYSRRHWDLTQSGITSPNYDIDLIYVDGDIFGTEANYHPVKYSGATWYAPSSSSFTNTTDEGTGSVTAGTNTIAYAGLTSFSKYAAVGDEISVLPVELMTFDVNKHNDFVAIHWSTASELNNDYFVLERSANGQSFEEIDLQYGFGTSTVFHDYQYLDEEPIEGLNYYRLKQVDIDGAITYTAIKSVLFESALSVASFTVFPNPSSQELFIKGDFENDMDVQVNVYSFNGQLIYNRTLESLQNGEVRTLPSETLSPGTYLIQIRSKDFELNEVWIKN